MVVKECGDEGVGVVLGESLKDDWIWGVGGMEEGKESFV